ncbi:MAG: ABC transporter ATP-binding protein/permease [Hyphomicrobium sp.]|uniref:ABC transporter ATP-binding protein n=1 Tax=Hyphomicrobium sp. TaxID=82 RepID=UPI001328385F|nr:ABC transporter ATP-binding protein [Hyphomicrobium sp.]KAB2941396.1 MAG: ABC transporter ATP-binding protein [Hyphomicrobium sp.]MBZ0212048.1 ABC transporter ATP-binding protein/permease [Hyphomicrobium sp.]
MIARIFSWLETRIESFPAEQPIMPPPSFWGFVFHYTRPFWPLLAVSAALSATIALIEVSLFGFLGNLVDWLSKANRGTFWTTHGTFLIGMAIVVLLILPVLKFFYESVVHQGLISNFTMRTRWQAHRYVLRQSMAFFNNDFAGRVATKVMQTAMSVREVVMKITEVLLYVAIYFTGAVFLFAATDMRLSAPLILWLAGYLVTMRHFIPRLGRISHLQSDARSIMTGRVVDSYTNISTVKMFAHAEREDTYALESMSTFLDTVRQQLRLVTLLTVALNCLNAALLFMVAGTSLWLWSIDAVTTGAIALSIGLVLRLQGMSHWIMWEVAGLFENVGVVQDGLETIARERSVVDAPGAKPLLVTKGEIVFDHIRFNYGRDASTGRGSVIEDLSLRVAPGEKVGLVGRSGAGKSTLVSLLLRFYDLDGGRVLIDGQDIAQVTQDSLRAQIGMVTQDTSLLHRSVLDNILYGRPDAVAADAIAAAKKAAAHDFIGNLEDLKGRTGYEAHVGERGVKLSGGQRQRVAIARVLLKDAPILVLDEATSALDSEVEAAIQEQLANLMKGKTVIAIAHRLSTIAAMDRLIIMDEGRIVEQGTHAELLRRGGLYAELWARQSGGFLAQDAAE